VAGVLDYSHGTYEHRQWLFRFTHRRRLARALALLDAGREHEILDFGSGDGHFLELLASRAAAARLTAFEPAGFLQEQIRRRLAGVPMQLITNAGDLAKLSFDRIVCLEVLEHLQPTEVESTVGILNRLLRPGGILVVSVPVEIGPTALFKYLASLWLTGGDRHYRLWEVLRASFCGRVARDTEVAFLPHKGFDHRRLRQCLAGRFLIEREVFSPLPLLSGVFNSQVIWRLKKRSQFDREDSDA
jgi:SAM-dependent methyltransferase